MIYSMTGYAAASRELPNGTLNLELRSVNSRYLDLQFRIVDELRGMESALRELVVGRLSRGKVECRLGITAVSGETAELHVNKGLMQKLLDLDRDVRAAAPGAAALSVAEILRWPGMIATEEVSREVVREACLELMRQALDEMSATRAREGEKLKAIIVDRAEQMRALAERVRPKLPAIIAALQSRLAERLKEAGAAADDERIRQELVLFAQRIDVDEELGRLATHLTEVKRVLDKGGAVGKRLDFLMQELNREANTLGSKSVDAEVSQIAMELKVLIEQMREQIQNIE
jgi:uncharacterized protein (TIGR00255 family)